MLSSVALLSSPRGEGGHVKELIPYSFPTNGRTIYQDHSDPNFEWHIRILKTEVGTTRTSFIMWTKTVERRIPPPKQSTKPAKNNHMKKCYSGNGRERVEGGGGGCHVIGLIQTVWWCIVYRKDECHC